MAYKLGKISEVIENSNIVSNNFNRDVDIVNNINSWINIGNLDNIKSMSEDYLSFIGKYIKDNDVDLVNLLNLTGLPTLVINNVIHKNTDMIAIELVLICRHLGLDYSNEIVQEYHIYNKKDTLLHYYMKARGVTKVDLMRLLGLRLSELDALYRTYELDKEQTIKLHTHLGIGASINLSLNAYDLFKQGNNSLLDIVIKGGVLGNMCDKTIEEKQTEIEDCVLRISDNKALIGILDKALIGIQDVLIDFRKDISNLLEAETEIVNTVKDKSKDKDVTTDNKTKDDSINNLDMNLRIADLELGKGVHKAIGRVINNKHYNAFYTLRLSKNLTLEKVSEDTGLTVKELKVLETFNETHNKNYCAKLRNYYGVDSNVYLDGVSDKVRLLGYLMHIYNVNVSMYAKYKGKNKSTYYKAKFKYDEDSEVTQELIKYLKHNKDLDVRINDYYKLTGLTR